MRQSSKVLTTMLRFVAGVGWEIHETGVWRSARAVRERRYDAPTFEEQRAARDAYRVFDAHGIVAWPDPAAPGTPFVCKMTVTVECEELFDVT